MGIAKKLIETLKEEVTFPHSKVNDSYMELVRLFPLQAITTKNQHAVALKVIEGLISVMNSGGTKDEGAQVYLKTLSEFVGDYEKESYKTATTSGRDMLAYLMRLQGLTQKDLAGDVGGQSVVSKILKGERELNLNQIQMLSKRFNVSPEVFIG